MLSLFRFASAVVFSFCIFACNGLYAYDHDSGCDSWSSGYVIKSVDENGKVVTLDDGSVWRVEDGFVTAASYWTPGGGTVDICDDHKLTNSQDGAFIIARRVR